jgi:hypothetical protein
MYPRGSTLIQVETLRAQPVTSYSYKSNTDDDLLLGLIVCHAQEVSH